MLDLLDKLAIGDVFELEFVFPLFFNKAGLVKTLKELLEIDAVLWLKLETLCVQFRLKIRMRRSWFFSNA